MKAYKKKIINPIIPQNPGTFYGKHKKFQNQIKSNWNGFYSSSIPIKFYIFIYLGRKKNYETMHKSIKAVIIPESFFYKNFLVRSFVFFSFSVHKIYLLLGMDLGGFSYFLNQVQNTEKVFSSKLGKKSYKQCY